jgi:DNA-binding CsgD family transcriptional regulator
VQYDAVGDRGRVGVATRYLAYVACRRNRLDQALAHLNEAASILEQTRPGWHVALTIAAIGSIAAALGEWRLAARALGAPLALFPIGVKHPNATSLEVADYENLSIQVKAKLGAEQFNRLLLEGKALSVERALREVSTLLVASGIASQPGNIPLLDTKPGAYPAGLSKREVELLRLVALGMSNADVAARLFLSANTVRAHLYSIYSKINVTSRTAAARFAVEHGLV